MNTERHKAVGKPLKAAIVGAGNRGIIYSSFALEKPDELRVVAVAEHGEYHIKNADSKFDIPLPNCCRFCKFNKMTDSINFLHKS